MIGSFRYFSSERHSMDYPEGEKRSKNYYDSDSKPQGSTAKLPALDPPLPPDLSDFASTDFEVIEPSPVPMGETPDEKPTSGSKNNPIPNALAPTVDAFQISPQPTNKHATSRKYASQTRKLSLGPSNLMLAFLWTFAIISVGWAIYFYLTQP